MTENATLRSYTYRQRAVPGLNQRFDLAQLPGLRRMFESRWPLFLARTATLAGFVFTILVGLFGPPVGSHNFAIIFVWIAWWSALKLVFIPFGGRSWCSVCPLPMPGEWLQQGGLIAVTGKRQGKGLRWPKQLRGYWLQASLFLLVGLFSAVTLTDPRVTAWVLLVLILLAATLSLIFERRAFCTSICPIGGLTGIYASAAPVELRVKDPALCATHSEKTCYWECPWGVYPLALRDNAACGLCMECLRVCPKDNIALNIRPIGTDLRAFGTKHRLDEVFMALVMLGSALSFAAVFNGSWGSLKSAAFNIGSQAWMGYGIGYLALNLLILPGMFALAVWLAQKLKRTVKKPSQAIASRFPVLVPLGLCSWIAFTLSFALPKMNYVFSVLSDPLGLGWNLLGDTAQTSGIDFSALSPILQVTVLLIGLYASFRWLVQFSAVQAGEVRKAHKNQFFTEMPVMVFCLLYISVLMTLLVS